MQTSEIKTNSEEIPTDEERINALLRKITMLNELEVSREENHVDSILQKIEYN
jgi:hypothetical protein